MIHQSKTKTAKRTKKAPENRQKNILGRIIGSPNLGRQRNANYTLAFAHAEPLQKRRIFLQISWKEQNAEGFSSVSSNNWLERMHSHIGCICSTFIKGGTVYWVGGKVLIINQSKPRLTKVNMLVTHHISRA